MNETRAIFLADGTLIQDCWVSCDAGSLWIYAPLSMKEGAEIFLDPAKTAEIRYHIGAEGQTYEGYTECQMLNKTPDALRILMVKGAA